MKLLAKWACTLFVLGMATASCSAASQVHAVYMALDTNGDRVRDTFYTDTDTINCDIDWVGDNPDMTVEAQFIQTYYEDPQTPGAYVECPPQPDGRPGCSLVGANEQPGPEGVATLAFTWTHSSSSSGGGKQPFPVGKYECRVFVNGQAAAIAPFKVIYPDTNCPAQGYASPNTDCQGWVRPGSQCTDAEDFTKTCVCSGTWVCQ